MPAFQGVALGWERLFAQAHVTLGVAKGVLPGALPGAMNNTTKPGDKVPRRRHCLVGHQGGMND